MATYHQDVLLDLLSDVSEAKKLELTNLKITGATFNGLTDIFVLIHIRREQGLALTIKTLDLSSNGLTKLPEDLFQELAFLNKLHLSRNRIRIESAKALSKALMNNSPLTHLDLADNLIGSDGAKALSEALMNNSSLTHLDLADNLIGSDGGKALSKMLENNTTLTHLNLRWNWISSDGATALSEALMKNTTLTHIDFGGYPSISIKTLPLFLKNNALIELKFDRTSFQTTEARALLEALDATLELNRLRAEEDKKLAFLFGFKQSCLTKPSGEPQLISWIAEMAALEPKNEVKLKEQEERVASLTRDYQILAKKVRRAIMKF